MTNQLAGYVIHPSEKAMRRHTAFLWICEPTVRSSPPKPTGGCPLRLSSGRKAWVSVDYGVVPPSIGDDSHPTGVVTDRNANVVTFSPTGHCAVQRELIGPQDSTHQMPTNPTRRPDDTHPHAATSSKQHP